jgi:hypothetical protein
VGLVVAFYAAPVVHELPQLNLFAVRGTIDAKVLVLPSSPYNVFLKIVHYGTSVLPFTLVCSLPFQIVLKVTYFA